MVGVDHQRQVAGAVDAIGLAREFTEGEDDQVGRAQHRERGRRAREHADFEAQILGDAGGDGIEHRAGMHAAVAGEDRAEALAAVGPVHLISPISQRFDGQTGASPPSATAGSGPPGWSTISANPRRGNIGNARPVFRRPRRRSRHRRPRRSAAADRRGGVRRDRGKAPPAAGPSGQAARGAAVPPADAAFRQRHRDRSRHLLPCHRGHRQGRCLDRLVPEPGRRLLDVGGLSRRAGGAGDLRQRSARRAGLGPGAAGARRRMRGRLSRHRRVGLRLGRPACDLARRALPDLAGRRLAAARRQRPAGRAHHAGAVERGRVDRHLERRRPARHGERPVRARPTISCAATIR